MRHLISALLILAIAAPALGQDAPAELSSTVVTGKREPGVKATTARVGSLGEAPLLDTPASVSVFNRQLLDAQHATLLTHAVLNDPSVAESYAPAGYYDSINIRGFELDVWNSYRINGMRISHDAAVALENKERIEILKGLGAVESGFSRPGGVVNYVTKRPRPAPFLGLELGYDRYHAFRQHLDFGAPADAAGNIAYRFNIANETLRSYARGADGDRRLGAAALDWRLAKGVKLELDAEYQERYQITVPGFQLLDGATVPAGVDPRVLMNAQSWTKPFFTRTATLQGKLDIDLPRGWLATLQVNSMRRKADDYVAFPYGFYANYDFDLYDYRSINETRNPRTVEAMFRGTLATGPLRHDLAFGASQYRNTISNPDQAFNFSGVGNYFAPVQLPAAPEPLYPAVSYRQRETGFYGQDTISFGPAWKLIAGGRQTRVERVATGAAEFEWRRDVFTPNFALLFKPRPSVSTYLNYAKGLEQGDPAPLGAVNQNQLLDPLASRQYEAGVKWDVVPDLNLQAALFRIEKPLEYVDATNTWIQNGKQVHTGIEFNASGRVTPELTVFGGVTLLDSEQQATGDPARDGRQKANVAKRRASVFVEYAPPGTGLAFNGRWQYAASRPATDDNAVWVDGYHVFGLGARYSTTYAGTPLVFGLSVDNVFDKNYWKDVGGGYLHLGAPRTWNASLQASWR
ncbi:MAG: TonB-dependent receptor [Betaproteobacteria bacterium]|nr:TonB-dependent receptor [Betaproteobacteria bacterium]